MKKIISYILTVIMVLSLCGCGQEIPGPTEPTLPDPVTEPTLPPTTAPTTPPAVTQPQDPPTEAPTTEPPTEPDEKQLLIDQVQELLSYDNYWYLRILGCTFEKPEDISLEHLFYNGMAPDQRISPNDFSDDEISFLKSALKDTFWGEEGWVNAIKLPVDQLNQVLNTYLGISLEDAAIPEKWIYYAEADAYYCVKTDAYSVGSYQVKHVAPYDDGTLEVLWTVDLLYDTMTGAFLNNPDRLLTLRLVDDHYVAVSNIQMPEGIK